MSLINRAELEAIKNHASNIPDVLRLYAPILLASCGALLREVERVSGQLAESQQERDEARTEVERLQSWTPIGTYSLDVQHEEERRRLTMERDEARAEVARLRETLARLEAERPRAATP